MNSHSIHHVTAVTAKIRNNRDFYTGALGLRLVKRSVNQDDVKAYHLFYADKAGSPGTDMTFFDWPLISANRPGLGFATLTTFGIPDGSAEYWRERLTSHGVELFPSEGSILFMDPEGQRLELEEVAGREVQSQPWTQVAPPEAAIVGILGVDLASLRPTSTAGVLQEVLGYQAKDDSTLEALNGTYGRVRLVSEEFEMTGRLGAGGVHHVAFRVADTAELLAKQSVLEGMGFRTSGLIDRYYFQSLYFREPGGTLFELATEGPGFASDEDPEHLGERLALPPFLEPRRAEIEAGLKPLD